MAILKIPKIFDDLTFTRFRNIWDSQASVEIILPKNLSSHEIDELYKFLLSKLPNSFAFCVLDNLTEIAEISPELLHRLFDYGDTGCNVTICLRDGLTETLMERCRSSDDIEVREHFLAKQKKLSDVKA